MFVCHALDRLITDSLTAIQTKTFQSTGKQNFTDSLIYETFVCGKFVYILSYHLITVLVTIMLTNVQSQPMIAVFYSKRQTLAVLLTLTTFFQHCMLLETYKIPYYRLLFPKHVQRPNGSRMKFKITYFIQYVPLNQSSYMSKARDEELDLTSSHCQQELGFHYH